MTDYSDWPVSKLMRFMIELDGVMNQIQEVKAKVKEELDSRD